MSKAKAPAPPCCANPGRFYLTKSYWIDNKGNKIEYTYTRKVCSKCMVARRKPVN
jgi:hypothetical protein